MARIKVTGYIESDDLPMEEVDLSHPMGLSSEGFERINGKPCTNRDSVANMRLSTLDDIETERADD